MEFDFRTRKESVSGRASSLDALRGYAIFTMILSSTIFTGALPAWMSHAQVGPRSGFVFDPSFYGITWVDLVLPFFIFAMGAAFPFSIGGKIEQGVSKWRLSLECVLRAARLVFFAIFIQHMYPWSISNPQDAMAWGIAILAFFLMFPMFMRFPRITSEWKRILIKTGAYIAGIALLLTVSHVGKRSFSLGYSNIIILLLANMSLFGSLIYLLTYRNKWARIAVLPFIMAVFLSSKTEGSWAALIMDFTPLPWMYKFYYLKYLFILIPGSIVGEYLWEWLKERDTHEEAPDRRSAYLTALLAVAVIVWNLYGLYTRQLALNVLGTGILLLILFFLLRGNNRTTRYWNKLFVAGAYLLMLGLFFEAYEGGIRKDDSTYSYYFVTSGLAFMAMIAFSVFSDIYRAKCLVRPLELAGQNPMIAYVAPQLLIMPLIRLAGLYDYLNLLNGNAWTAFLRGVIITSVAMGVAAYCSRKKWFWRT